jgi:hypothetical protein
MLRGRGRVFKLTLACSVYFTIKSIIGLGITVKVTFICSLCLLQSYVLKHPSALLIDLYL